MKYFVIPLLNYFYSTLFTLGTILFYLIYLPMYCLWHLKFDIRSIMMYRFCPWLGPNLSVFFEYESSRYRNDYYFHSYFHYIWGIKPCQSQDELMVNYKLDKIAKEKIKPSLSENLTKKKEKREQKLWNEAKNLWIHFINE